MLKQVYYYFLALRPKQRIKNIIIFIPLLFSHLFTDIDSILRTFVIFIIFCIFAGCTYIFNDYKDIEKDRQHPQKKNRPIASGNLNKKLALTTSIILLIATLILSFIFGGISILILFLAYLTNTVLYTLIIKNFEILDVFSIAIGFIIRGLIGVYIINVELSPRLLIILFFGALWFGFLKRYQEVMLSGDIRKNINKYNDKFLEQVISIVTGIVIISYALYTFNSVQSKLMVITIPFIAYIIIRYYYNIFFLKKYEDSIETIILHDKSIIISGILLVITLFIILI